MVAVIDPNGTPQPVYTRSGTSIQEITATGTTFGTAAPIVAVSGRSVVTANGVSEPDATGVILPVNAQIGDVVEIYCGNHSAQVYPPDGEQIQGLSHIGLGANTPGILFRKTTATMWRYIK